MRTAPLIAVMVLASACWRLDDPRIDQSVIPLENSHSKSTEDLVVQTYLPVSSTPLFCPDGQGATFYAVYDRSILESEVVTGSPVALVFHSGAFDYVVNRGQGDPLQGDHYAGEDRLSLDWAQGRVFSTLGMWDEDVDPGERHTGSLAIALAREGFLTLYAPNCWGDLWHNAKGRQENDVAADGFERNGYAIAWWMYRFATDKSFAEDRGISLPLPVDQSAIYLLGLGDGGRALQELLRRVHEEEARAPAGLFLDSTPDNLSFYTERAGAYPDQVTGLNRIFADRISGIEEYSLEWLLESGEVPLPERTMVMWSRSDPAIPAGTLSGLTALLQDTPGAAVVEVSAAQHVFSNSDLPRAYDVVNYLLGD